MPETGKYGIVYADPPWRYDMKRGKGVAENHYPTMSIDEMIQLIKRLLDFSGKQRKNLIASFVFSLLDSVFEMMPIMAILTVLSRLLSAAEGGVMPVSTLWVSFAIMVVSIAGRIFFNNLSCIRRTLGSFSMCSEKRLEIGEHMQSNKGS